METNIQGKIFQLNSEIEWQNAGPGIQRQIFGYGEQVMMVKVKFEKDAVGTLHHHPHVQVTYVGSGAFEVSIGGEKKTLRAGDGFYVPSAVEHGVLCLEAGVLIDVFTPVREDFLS
jgi:quercetin dioxygenase-like cupin family protein